MRLLRSTMAGALATTAAAVLLLAPPAGAHDGGAVITLEGAHPAGTSVHFIVRVTWEDDGDPATDATVAATAVDGDGNQLTPVRLAPIDDDGRYASLVEFSGPGTWTVRFTSVNPTGSAEVTQEVDAAAAATGDAGDARGAADEGGFAPADDGTGASGTDAADNNDGGGSGMPVWLVVAAAVVALGGGFLSVRTVRRYRAEAAAENTQFEELGAAQGASRESRPAGPADPGPKART